MLNAVSTNIAYFLLHADCGRFMGCCLELRASIADNSHVHFAWRDDARDNSKYIAVGESRRKLIARARRELTK